MLDTVRQLLHNIIMHHTSKLDFDVIQMCDKLSTNGELLRVAEVKSSPAKPKSMRSVNRDQCGVNLKKKLVNLAGSHCMIDVGET